MGPQDSGAEGAPVVYAAYPGERPVLSGGRAISGRQRGTGELWMADIPEVKAGTWYFHQLFVNGQRRPRARHPNEDHLRTVGNLPEITDVREQRNEPAAKLGFTYKPGDIRPWAGLEDVNVVLYYDWSTSRHWVKEVRESDRTIHFTNPTGWPVCFWEKEQRYHLENFREALDQPGEWYLNRGTGTLHYWPLPGEDLATAAVIAPRLEHILELRGDPGQQRFVEHVTFRGLSLQFATWEHDKTQQAEAQAAVFLTGAVYGRGVRSCAFERCEIAHVGEYALWLEDGCQANRIARCEIDDVGGGGVRIGSAGYTEDPDVITERNVVDNCFIHDAGHVFPDGVGIWIGHSGHNQLTHNEICDVIYSGISVGWSWGYGPSGAHHNLIEWNHIHHLGFGVLSELSAIYTLGVSPGTRIAHNVLHDTYDYAYGSWGIGLDEGTSGVVVEGNIIYNHGHGIGLHYGRDNLIRNNIIALCRADLLGVGRVEDHQCLEFRNNVCYADGCAIATGNWAQAKIVSDHNLYWDKTLGADVDICGLFLDEWQEESGQDQHSLAVDPGFATAAQFDFRLATDSAAAEVGFRPVDVSGAGLYGDEEWVAKPGKIVRRPIQYEARIPAAALTSFEDDFEQTAPGQQPKLARVHGETGGASVRVSDEAAASGKHSLKFTDAAGLEANWQPHLVYSPRVRRGHVELSFDVRMAPDAILIAEWRDWRNELLVGPSVKLVAGGQIEANGKPVLETPVGRWLRVVISGSVGAKARPKYRLTVTAWN